MIASKPRCRFTSNSGVVPERKLRVMKLMVDIGSNILVRIDNQGDRVTAVTLTIDLLTKESKIIGKGCQLQ